MSKKYFMGMSVAMLTFGMIIVGCTFTPSTSSTATPSESSEETIVYKDASGDDSVTLVLSGEGTSISEFDGDPVNWTNPKNTYRSPKIKVPAGVHTLTMISISGVKNESTIDLISGQDYEINSSYDSYPSITQKEKTTTRIEPKTTSSSSGGTTYVKGYYRKDGTYVKGHTRRRK